MLDLIILYIGDLGGGKEEANVISLLINGLSPTFLMPAWPKYSRKVLKTSSNPPWLKIENQGLNS